MRINYFWNRFTCGRTMRFHQMRLLHFNNSNRRLKTNYFHYKEIYRNISSSPDKKLLVDSVNKLYSESEENVDSSAYYPDVSNLLSDVEKLRNEDTFEAISSNPILRECEQLLYTVSPDDFFQVVDVFAHIAEKFPNLYYRDRNLMLVAWEMDRIFFEVLKFDKNNLENVSKLIRYVKVLPKNKATFNVMLLKSMHAMIKYQDTSLLLAIFQHINSHFSWNVYHVDYFDIEMSLLLRLNKDVISINDVPIMLKPLIRKNPSSATPELVKVLFKKFVDEYHEITIASKALYFQYWANHINALNRNKLLYNDDFKILTQRINDEIDSVPLFLKLEILFYLSNANHNDHTLFHKIALSLCQISDICKEAVSVSTIVKAVSYLIGWNHPNDDNIYETLLRKIKTEPLFSSFKNAPKQLTKFLSEMSTIGIYDYHLLNVVLSNDFLQELHSNKLNHCSVKDCVLFLDTNTYMDCPDYDGPHLCENIRKAAQEKATWHLPFIYDEQLNSCHDWKFHFKNSTVYTRTLYDVKETLINILGGKEFIHTCYITPHILLENHVFAMHNNRPQSLEHLRNKRVLSKEMINPEFIWYSFVTNQTSALSVYTNGLSVNIARWMSKMGIKQITITMALWRKLNDEEKVNHLKILIDESC